jgi:hypothetical protein
MGDTARNASAQGRGNRVVTEADPLPWLLEPDNPSARYLALTGLMGYPAGAPDVLAARAAIGDQAPVRAILDAQWPEGYWVAPGIGYSPKYKATVWQVVFLAAMGAPRSDAIDRACSYVLDHSRLADGLFSARKSTKGALVCLNGNLLRAMYNLDYQDPRVEASLEALAEKVLSEDFRCRFNGGSPVPARMRQGLPCAWGAVKALAAFAEVPASQRSVSVRAAIDAGITLLLAGDPARGKYPTATAPSPLWGRLGFPLGYSSDLYEALEVLGRLGVKSDSHLMPAVETALNKQDQAGRWSLEYSPGNTWADFGPVGMPNKWATLRALRALSYWV